MSIEEQVKLRRTRVASATRRGKVVRKVEMVSVMTCENLNTKSCREFIYLESKIDTSTSATPEIERRIIMAMVSFGKLNRIWKAKSLSRRTKAALYQAIIVSVMLYNAEVWPIRQQDTKALELGREIYGGKNHFFGGPPAIFPGAPGKISGGPDMNGTYTFLTSCC